MSAPAGLSGRQRRALVNDGYVVVPRLLDATTVRRLAERLDDVVRTALTAWRGGRPPEEAGVVAADIDPADPVFEICHRHPVVAAAVASRYPDNWRLCGLDVRAPLPGFGHQGLHADFDEPNAAPRTGATWRMLAAMWCVTAFTRDNGTLRVVPGSHRMGRQPDIDRFGSAMGPQPGERKLVAPAGSLILFNNADLWHSGTFNYSTEPRLAVTAHFSGRADD